MIADAIINEKIENFRFYTMARLTRHYNNTQLTEKLRKAGFYSFSWGLESGCPKTLDAMKKGTKENVISDILRKTSQAGIMNFCFVLFGFPGESLEDAEKTVSFLKENADYIDDVMAGTFNLHKEALISKDPDKWNITIYEDGSYVNKKGLSVDESVKFHRAFQAKRTIESIRVSSRKFSFYYDEHVARMQRFLRNCHHPIHSQEIKKSLRKKSGTDFPHDFR